MLHEHTAADDFGDANEARQPDLPFLLAHSMAAESAQRRMSGRMSEKSAAPGISVIAPVYNERENLRELHAQIQAALEKIPLESEILYIDDGSSDGSADILREIAESTPNAAAILFRRNFGQTAALSAGFQHAAGDVVVALDADLQNDPADIPRLLEKLDEGYDLVSGWRKKRAGRVSAAPPSVHRRQPTHTPPDRGAVERLRLHIEGVPQRGG